MTMRRMTVIRKDAGGQKLSVDQQGVKAYKWTLTYTFDKPGRNPYDEPAEVYEVPVLYQYK